jgi:hypothetical protein
VAEVISKDWVAVFPIGFSAGARKPVSIMCRSMMSPIAATSDGT